MCSIHRLTLFVLIAIAASAGAIAAPQPIEFTYTPPGASESVTSVRFVETIDTGSENIELIYSPTHQLIAAQRRDRAGMITAFRHRYEVAGVAHWTGWLPASMLQGAQVAWPVDGALSISPSRGTRALWSLDAASAARIAPALEGLETPAESLPAFNYALGSTDWSWDESKWQPWNGYLWDFAKGYLWRGYRKTSKGETITPSQYLDTSDMASLQAYYAGVPADIWKTTPPEKARLLSPLDKFGFWQKRRGLVDQWWYAPSWEGINHGKNMGWGGYCNGSAAMALLWKKPQKTVIDQDIAFEQRDLVGILQAMNYAVDSLFWGYRYWDKQSYQGAAGLPEQSFDMADPSPQLVIEVLSQYLGKQGTPVVTDYMADDGVDNAIIVKANVQIEKNGRDPLERKGKLTLKLVHYNDRDPIIKQDEVGTVPDWDGKLLTGEFRFEVTLNADGTVASSRWRKDSEHPDFLWIPLANRDYPATESYRNPYLMVEQVRELVNRSY